MVESWSVRKSTIGYSLIHKDRNKRITMTIFNTKKEAQAEMNRQADKE